MTIDKNYDPSKHEEKIYKKWEASGAFKPKEDAKETFSIVMPPPNATGQLHLGHAAMLAIEDIIVRFKRMQGYSTLWLPGTDSASIATQNKVESILLKKGITREDLGREKFVKEVENYIEDSQDTIKRQVRKMGASCDWSRERYTLEPDLVDATQEAFIKMYNDGIIYRGNRIVNWCPRCSSTLADDEVEYKETHGKFYYLKYGPFVIGTARPETKFGDKTVFVHPDDERYKEYHGKEIEVEWINGRIKAKVIADTVMDMELGTGVMTVTPAHSFTDFELAEKYDLEIVQIIDEHARITDEGGKDFKGLTTLEARDKVIEVLKEKGLVEDIDQNYIHNLSVCYRCSTPIEPLISRQWFVDVDTPVIDWKGSKKSLKEVSINVVKDGQIEIMPDKFNKTYFHWMENLHNWCISRQIWFGQRIPIWYSHDEVVASKSSPGDDFQQDPDTLDTWFTTGLWTFASLGWPKQTDDLKRFHPTQVLETGYDILFFWVARMILMSVYCLQEVPFEKVYLHGLVRDKQGRKMSKSLGNGIDPLDMIDKYGTDAVRLSLVIGTSPGNDVKLYEDKIASYRNFVTKVWNSARYALLNVDPANLKLEELTKEDLKTIADKWIIARTEEVITSVTKSLNDYRFSEAGTEIYNFLWSEFCDWYLEVSKVNKNDKVLIYVLSKILIMLHPFTPFVTEKLWSELSTEKLLIEESWPTHNPGLIDDKATREMDNIIRIITSIRSMKADFNLATESKLKVTIIDSQKRKEIEDHLEIIKKLARIEDLDFKSESDPIKGAAASIINKDIKVYLHLDGKIDLQKELQKIEKEIAELEKFEKSLSVQLNNEGFVSNAPEEVIETKREQLEDTTKKIEALKQRSISLKN